MSASLGTGQYVLHLESLPRRERPERIRLSVVFCASVLAVIRDWLSRNRDYASRPREQSGLGLPDIDPELDGLVIMGRDAQLDSRNDALRRRLQRQHRVRIETYDWLARQARSRLAALERSRSAYDDGPQDAGAASPEDAPAPAGLVRDAVEAVFGGMDSMGDVAEKVIVEHTAGLGFVTVAYGEGDEDREVIPVNIVDAYRPDGVLPFLDWDLWWNAANDLDAWGSLMVSELVPLAELQRSLTQQCPGVWINTFGASGLTTRNRRWSSSTCWYIFRTLPVGTNGSPG